MCMKNVNMNMLLCDIVPRDDSSDISLANVLNKKMATSESTDGVREVSRISLVLLVSATETKDQEAVQKIDAETTFSFSAQYDLRIRLTETISGDYIDLDDFLLEPVKYAVENGLCRKTLNHTRIYLFSDIVLPERKEKECFALKSLIRVHDDSRTRDDGWYVQAILPVEV